jgi:cation-transporting ATPase 13A3/4/5
MTIGTAYSMFRLQEKEVYSISPGRINVAGRVRVMVFDKTGTLTEDGLQVFGFRVCIGDPSAPGFVPEFDMFTDNINTKYINKCQPFTNAEKYEKTSRYLPVKFLETMVCCNELTLLDDNQLVGDPLDLTLFNSSSWELNDSDPILQETSFLAKFRPKDDLEA